MARGKVAMLLIDVILIVVLLIAFAVGMGRGFFASLGLIVGMVAGALAALWLMPLITPAVSDVVPIGPWRSAALAALAIVIVVVVAALGAAIGGLIRRGVDRTPLKRLERFLGGVISVVATALAVLITGSAVTAAGIPGVSSTVASSQVLRVLDDLTPAPVDGALAQLRGIVVDDTLPRLGDAIGTVVTPTDPPIVLDDPDLQAASASVARIGGTAYACGVSMTGSGFVVADDLVVTNAHVVAGVEAPVIEMPGGETGEGRIVYFDPVDDLAVIAVEGLDAPPLAVADPVAPGTQAVVQGYPLGGPFTSSPAAVLSVQAATVPDIYAESSALREIYALDVDVQPGNSGGPLLTDAGEVVGVVFGRGDDGERRGYAMTTNELRPLLDTVRADDPAVASGRCTS